MADNTLNVKVEADVKDLTKGLKNADAQIKGFGNTVNDTIGKINNTKKSISSAGSGFDALGKKVKVNAVPSITEFSRVIQDAPFGITGVANNIQQLTSVFGQLQQKTGGTKQALQAMAATLTGPAGVLLAVSLVTSLLVSFGDEIVALFDKTAKLAKKQKELSEALNATTGTISAQVSALDAQIKLSQAQGLATDRLEKKRRSILDIQLRTLKAQKQSLQTELKQNTATAKKLSTWEKIQNVFASQKVTKEEAAANPFFEEGEERGLNFYKAVVAKVTDEEKKALEEIKTSIANVDEQIAKINLEAFKVDEPELFKLNTKKAKQNLTEYGKLFRSELGALRFGILDATRQFQKEVSQELTTDIGGRGIDIFGGLQKSIDNTKLLVPKDLLNLSLLNDEARVGINKLNTTLKEGFVKGGDELIPITNRYREAINSSIPPAEEISERMMFLKEQFTKFNEDAKGLIQGSLANTFSQVGQTIGQALADGGNVIGAVGKSLLSGLAGFLGDLGKLMIQYGVAGLAYSNATKALTNPYSAAPAAGALIAAGIALTAISGAISGALKSGSNNSSSSRSGGSSQDFSTSGTSTNFSSTPSVSSGSGGNFVFEIQGTKLIGVLKNTLDRNRALGGQNNLVFS